MKRDLSPLVLVAVLAGCSGAVGHPNGAGGSPSESGGAGGDEETGGATGGRRGGTGGSTGESTGGSSGSMGGKGGTATGGTGDTGGSGGDDAGAGGEPGTEDAGPTARDAALDTTPGKLDASPPINVNGKIPPYEGPPVGPEVKMDCPGDPTTGFTEYKDTFSVEHPYDLPVASRFSVEGGIYNFWVMKGDKPHSSTTTALNPRTEANFTQKFKTGIRMWSADVFWEPSVTKGTVVMQVHTTSTGIGPVYLVANGNDVPPISGSKVPGGLFNRWINLKVLINADTTASQYWVNNCMVASKGSGTRGDGNNYFKMGVYHCDSGTCRDRYKNVHLYIKQ